MDTYEKLGAFYLGRIHDLEADRTTDDLLLYDAKDLTTHGVCVGMTGSGKTGLCLALLEEAAIDEIPAIVIDPKGDLGNLMLTFPRLRPDDFLPWIDPGEASRKGMSPAEFAADRAALWRRGLAEWGQGPDRIERFRQAADIAIYTPGSTAGLPLTVLRSFQAPPAALREDREALGDRVAAAVSGLLALLGIDADPIRSREHILIATILEHAWRAGRDLDVAALIREIQSPPFGTIGVIDLDSFFPARDRFELAMLLNNLLASPGFATWMEGEPLEIGRLLYTPEGRPRISILSIAHLSETERMFFVTILLNEVVAWMRTQPGTSSLRAILYMDEIFGFFPPTANPPSKKPMLTLLKQARAFGLGVLLATQNPVDLDYKGLSNTGTWFLGRLQTERDKQRVLEGLEGASVAAGSSFDRSRMEKILAGLGSRVFLLNNVHEDEPVLFHTRWVLSYLRGPMTRNQIQTLMAPRKTAAAPPPTPAPPETAAAGAIAAPAPAADGLATLPPPVAPGIEQHFLPLARRLPGDEPLVYRPGLVGIGRMHFVRVAAKVDLWRDVSLYAPLDDDVPTDPWEQAEPLAAAANLEIEPAPHARFASLPAGAAKAATHRSWKKAFVDHLYRNREMTIYKCRELKSYSRPEEDEGHFRIRLRQLLHEKRDLTVEKLRKRYAPKLARLEERIRKARDRIEKEQEQFKQAGFQTAISLGSTVLGALFGRKKASVGTVGRAATTLRGAGRTARQRGDVGRAKEDVRSLEKQLADLEREFEEEVERVHEDANVDRLEFEEIIVRPRKSDMSVKTVGLAWAPYRVSDGLVTEPAYSL